MMCRHTRRQRVVQPHNRGYGIVLSLSLYKRLILLVSSVLPPPSPPLHHALYPRGGLRALVLLQWSFAREDLGALLSDFLDNYKSSVVQENSFGTPTFTSQFIQPTRKARRRLWLSQFLVLYNFRRHFIDCKIKNGALVEY